MGERYVKIECDDLDDAELTMESLGSAFPDLAADIIDEDAENVWVKIPLEASHDGDELVDALEEHMLIGTYEES